MKLDTIELVHKIRIGDVDSAREIMEQADHENIEMSPEYVYALRTAISRNDTAMCRMLTSFLENDGMIDHQTVTAAAYKDITVFIEVVGVDGHCLANKELEQSTTHPLVAAASVGNSRVAKFIIDWIREGGIKHLDNVVKLKQDALLAAAMSKSVSIIKLLATDKETLRKSFKDLVKMGHSDAAKRLANDTRLDFAENNFELLRDCAPFPNLLDEVMKNPSLKAYQTSMPTVYSQLAMDNAINSHEEKNDALVNSFQRNLKLHASNKILATGCGTREAVTAAHAELNGHLHDHHGKLSFYGI